MVDLCPSEDDGEWVWEPALDVVEPGPLNQKCNWCSKIKPMNEFRAREFASGTRHVKTCFVCEPKKSQNRKAWVKSETGQKWYERTNGYESVAASKAVHRASELKAQTEQEYRSGPLGVASAQRKRQKLRDNPDLRIMANLTSKIAHMAHGLDNRKTSRNVLHYTGFGNAEEILAHFKDTADFELDQEKWHIDHTIAKVWYQFAFDGQELRPVTMTEEIMKMCWHRNNLEAVRASENISKSFKLPPDDVLMQCKAFWPPHWKKLPCPEYRRAMHRKVRSRPKV